MAGESLGRYRESLEREKRRAFVSDCDSTAACPSKLMLMLLDKWIEAHGGSEMSQRARR
jgi:hypothetical protein